VALNPRIRGTSFNINIAAEIGAIAKVASSVEIFECLGPSNPFWNCVFSPGKGGVWMKKQDCLL
jgi:hypothetical protein